MRFVLAGSGHIAGVVNPPGKPKYQYWTGGPPRGAFEAWLEAAKENPGSWWPDWLAWLDGAGAGKGCAARARRRQAEAARRRAGRVRAGEGVGAWARSAIPRP